MAVQCGWVWDQYRFLLLFFVVCFLFFGFLLHGCGSVAGFGISIGLVARCFWLVWLWLGLGLVEV